MLSGVSFLFSFFFSKGIWKQKGISKNAKKRMYTIFAFAKASYSVFLIFRHRAEQWHLTWLLGVFTHSLSTDGGQLPHTCALH